MTFFTIISYIYDFQLAQLLILNSVDSNSKQTVTAKVDAASFLRSSADRHSSSE